MPDAPISFAFSPAGLLFPFYVGVAYELQGRGLINSGTPIGGSSAGAIVAAAIACGVPEAAVRRALLDLVSEVRRGASLKEALRAQLEALLPEDCHIRCSAHRLRIGYMAVLPWPRRHLVSEWSGKADMIEVITASCNWPLYLSRWPFVRCRGAWAVDGFFSVPRSRFGCPPLPAAREVAVTALPKVALPAFGDAELIQAGKQHGLPVGAERWFYWAYSPATDEELDMLIELGRRHASEWADADAAAAGAAATKAAPGEGVP